MTDKPLIIWYTPFFETATEPKPEHWAVICVDDLKARLLQLKRETVDLPTGQTYTSGGINPAIQRERTRIRLKIDELLSELEEKKP
jgi:hypothetical protein